MTEIELLQTDDGVLLPVQAQPRARRPGVVGIHAGRLKVAVTEVPEKGRANDAIAAALAEELHLKAGQIELHRGATSTKKVFRIVGITSAELQQRIAALGK
ncbi:MAG: DUF167 domain-containing protein [Planctomycetaceae bacterium]